MRCPVCNNTETKVTDSRVALDGTNIRRRRECIKCNFRYSTIEQMTILDLIVIKRDGRREPYSREKLERGLSRSLEKRPYTKDKFQRLINRIETDIQRTKRSEITSSQMGEIVMKRLKRFDKVSYIRFASVYRSFEDVKTFQRELNKLTKKKSNNNKKRNS